MNSNLTSRQRKHSLNKQNILIHQPPFSKTKSHSLNKNNYKESQLCINLQGKYLMAWGQIPFFSYKQTTEKNIFNITKDSVSFSIGQTFVAYIDKNYHLNIIGDFPTQNLRSVDKKVYIDKIYLKQFSFKKVFSTPYSIFLISCQNELLAFGLNNRGQLGLNHHQFVKQPTILNKYQSSNRQSSCNQKKRSSSKIKINSLYYQNKVLSEKTQNKILEEQNHENHDKVMQNNCIQTRRCRENFLSQSQQILKIQGGPFHTAILTNKGKLFYSGNKYTKKGIQSDQYLMNFEEINLDKIGKVIDLKSGLTNIAVLTSQGKIYLMGLFNQNTIFDQFTNIQIEKIKSFALSKDNIFLVNEKGQGFKVNIHYKNSKIVKYSLKQNFRQVQASINYAIFISQNGALFGQGSNLNGQLSVNKNIKYFQQLIPIEYFQFKAFVFQLKCSPKFVLISSEKTISSYQNINLNLNFNKQAKGITKSIKIQTQVENKSIFSNLSLSVNPRTFQNDLQIQFSQIKLGKKIAQGGYGIIYQGHWRKSIVAIKIFKIDENNQNSIKDFVSQCHAMEILRHPNIVMFLGACIKSPNYGIVLQYCQGGTLWSLLQSKIQLNWFQKFNFCLDIAKAMNYLHSRAQPILHRDLKSLNILLDGNKRVKLADFGWTKGLQNYMTGKIGTYQWMAPQVIAAQQYTEKADIYSFSIILWQIAARQAPYKNIPGLQVAYDVVNKDLRPIIPKDTPQFFKLLIIKCWNKEANLRPSFSQIIDQLQKIRQSFLQTQKFQQKRTKMTNFI